jgi:hypothetical protein
VEEGRKEIKVLAMSFHVETAEDTVVIMAHNLPVL